jgi:hypothetical protein
MQGMETTSWTPNVSYLLAGGGGGEIALVRGLALKGDHSYFEIAG